MVPQGPVNIQSGRPSSVFCSEDFLNASPQQVTNHSAPCGWAGVVELVVGDEHEPQAVCVLAGVKRMLLLIRMDIGVTTHERTS